MQPYFLSPEIALQLDAAPGSPTDRWMPVPHSGIVRPAYILVAGDRAVLADNIVPGRHDCLLVSYGAAHPDLSADGATLAIELECDGQIVPLAVLSIPGGADGLSPREARFDLGAWASRTCRLWLGIGAGPQGDPSGDWVALYELVVASTEDLSLVRARAFNGERTHNELAHFAHVYDHAMYAHADAPSPSVRTAASCRQLSDLLAEAPRVAPAFPGEPSAPPSQAAPENAHDPYHFAHDLLTREIGAAPPDFAARARALTGAGARPLRILSLCCGAARIEALIARHAGIPIEWTLMDLNEDLLRSAAARFPDDSSVKLIVGNLNEIRDYGRRYDAMICVSGLHHIVELERVVGFVRDALVEGGEFWSIGEAVGRNGNRLWPRDYAAANEFFRRLPERLRRNRSTGKIDADLPDTDYSASTFEGIRSEDIEPLLSRFLEPVELYRRNCFLWRIVDLAYADNYDMSSASDLDVLRAAVVAELAHFRAGGRSAELHGVFRRPVDRES